MKALILAAGFGTRLKPHSDHTPKPLFPIAGKSVLDRMIDHLVRSGCTAVAVNTHHLHGAVAAHLHRQRYPVPVTIYHEPEILGTGGAVKNLNRFWGKRPFVVVNGDILTDIDIAAVYRAHVAHRHPVTLVLHDHADYNSVCMDAEGFVRGFSRHPDKGMRQLAFTGVQILDPMVLDWIPDGRFYHSIDLYRQLIAAEVGVRAIVCQNHRWIDIGTPQTYRKAAFGPLASKAFQNAFGEPPNGPIQRQRLQGDGSDRQWWRLSADDNSLIMVDHGIRSNLATAEVDAFVDIGRHLSKRHIPVPTIHAYDRFSGMVFLQDLGDVHLQDAIGSSVTVDEAIGAYEPVVDHLVDMAVHGARGFDPRWTYQSSHYDRQLILKHECRYFVEAFLQGYLGMRIVLDPLRPEFEALADGALQFGQTGFMHRDLQSRNIMVTHGRIHFIDFQGGRLGPLQYDLAALLIDPYVDLPEAAREHLAAYAFERLCALVPTAREAFYKGYRHCAVTRNLQILGAFGYLSRRKGKTGFEAYIPTALRRLKHNLVALNSQRLPVLTSLVEGVPA